MSAPRTEKHRSRSSEAPPATSRRRGVLGSGYFWAGLLIAAAGIALWAYALATREPAPPLSARGLDGLVSGLAQGSGAGPSSGAPVAPRLIDEASPALARFGASFAAGFFMGAVFRRLIRWTLMLAGLGAIAFFVARQSWYFQSADLSQVEHAVEEGVELVKASATTARDWVLGYVPTAGAGVAGMFLGARRG